MGARKTRFVTAVLLKVMLVLLGGVEHRVTQYFKAKETPWATAIGAVLVFGILFGGKLLILEVVNLVFGDRVELGHFVELVALILTMIDHRSPTHGLDLPTPLHPPITGNIGGLPQSLR